MKDDLKMDVKGSRGRLSEVATNCVILYQRISSIKENWEEETKKRRKQRIKGVDKRAEQRKRSNQREIKRTGRKERGGSGTEL